MKQKIKVLRVEIDGLASIVKGLSPLEATQIATPQLEKCYNSLILGKAWLGKCLGALNVASPYQNDGKRKTVADIEPTADTVVNGENPFSPDFTHIQKVDWLREKINEVNARVLLIDTGLLIESVLIDNVFTHLSEARFWLGFELERIRETK